MLISSRSIALLALALTIFIVGCGQKGPLYLPKEQKTETTPNNPPEKP